jgi:hypothetical protein
MYPRYNNNKIEINKIQRKKIKNRPSRNGGRGDKGE